MAINQKGMDLIKHFEGSRLTAYKDPVGIWTIGWGHTGPDVYPGLQISLKQAEQFLEHDLVEHEDFVKNTTSVPLNGNQLAAVVSFAFNAGNGNFKSSTLRKKLNKKDYNGAADELLKWVYGTPTGRRSSSRASFAAAGRSVIFFLAYPSCSAAPRGILRKDLQSLRSARRSRLRGTPIMTSRLLSSRSG